MKLFVAVLGTVLVVAAMSWMTLALDKIQQHHDEMKRAREAASGIHPH